MMGPKQEAQAALFYEFSLEDHVPQDHLLRSIDLFVDLSSMNLVPVPGHWGTLPLSMKGAPNGIPAAEIHRRL